MSIWWLAAAFLVYSFGIGVERGAREDSGSFLVGCLCAIPFEIAAYLIVGSQVGLHA